MGCFNRNTQEYKDLLRAFNSNMQVDGIITAWQKVNNSDAFPSVNQATQFLKGKKTVFNLKQKDFADTLLSNLSRKNIISKYKDAYYVNNSNRGSKSYNPLVLQSNINKIKRFLDINNIPIDAVQFTPTRKSVKITVNESMLTQKDLLESSRAWNKNRTRHIIVHLMRMFPDINIKLASVFEAKAYYDSLPEWQKSDVSFDQVNSYFDPVTNQVVLIEGRVTDETAIEEILHPFTDALFIDNKELFNSLLEESKKIFPALAQEIEDTYTNRKGFDEKDRNLELVTQALTRHFKKEYEENPTKTFKERVKEFLEWFAGIINNLHKYITGINIPSLRSSEIVQPSQQQGSVKEGVPELFESNPELANAVYEALGFEQMITPNDKIVFGHPTIGKSFLKNQGENKFISLDDDYATEINNKVKEIADKYNVTTYQVKDGGTQNWNNEYNQMMQEMFNVAKQRAISENKTLFTSNTNLLRNNAESFDKVINLTDKEFERRIQERGAKYDIKEWKSQINQAISKIPINKVINTDKYLSDLFITPQQKQQAQEQYSQYLDTIFPDSKVKDIVYHGTKGEKFDTVDFTKSNFGGNVFYVSTDKSEAKGYARKAGNVLALLINAKNVQFQRDAFFGNTPQTINEINQEIKDLENLKFGLQFIGEEIEVKFFNSQKEAKEYAERNSGWETLEEKVKQDKLRQLKSLLNNLTVEGEFDTVLTNNDAGEKTIYIVNKLEQIHILGSKQDIEGFREFVNKNQTSAEVTTLNLQDIKPTATLSDIAKLLNTSDIKFDINAKADVKVRFSLTPDLQSTVDYALRQSNAIQAQIIKKLFNQAQAAKEEVGSLSAGEGGPIVILNEENHVYYNLLDTTETFRSTTERIKGKLSEEDLFNKKLNIDLGNDFDKLLQGLTSDKTLDEVFPQMKILSREQAEKAYLQLQENLKEITRGGGVAIPQVVVYDLATRTAGSIDILVVLPDGKLRIVDLKTSKNSVRDMTLSQKAKAKAGLEGQFKYDVEYELGDDSDLKKAGINQLSTRAQQAIQVNLYRRMLENMGYEVDMGDMAASTFHIQVGVKGKDSAQEFTGEFRSDEWVGHKPDDARLYVDILVPSNVDTISLEEMEKAIDEAFDKPINWNEELTDDEKIPEDSEFTDPYTEFEVITQALENYRLALTTKLKAMEQIKSAIYMDRTKEQTQENILNALSAISMAMSEGPKARAALFTEFLRDAFKQIKNFTEYVEDPANFDKPEYITYVLNFNRFIKTFEGLYSVKNLDGVNATQRSLILRLQTQLNNLGASNSKQEGLINEAITNYVKAQVKNWSSRDDLTEDILNDIINGTATAANAIIDETRDIGNIELNTYDLSTSRNTILAIMDKIYKSKKQELLDRVDTRNRTIAGLAARLQKLSPNKNPQQMYEYMHEFDANGDFTGRYVKRLGRKYFEKQEALRSKLLDDNGNQLQYKDIEDVATARIEDLEHNIKLAKAKAEYAAFWAAEKVGLDDKLKPGDFHTYTDEFKTERAKFQYYVPINGKAIWRRKPGVSDRAYRTFLAKYYNEVEYTYAIKDQNGNPTGAIKRDSTFFAVKPEYRFANDYNTSTGERLISEKYEKIMNPTDALGQAQKDFYLAFVDYYENQFLKKIPAGYRSQMLGKVPIIKGKLFQDIKGKPNIVGKLWSKTTRSISNLVSETAQQRGIVTDEDGNLVDQLPIFYTGRARTDAELAAANADVDALNDQFKKGLVTRDKYEKEMPVLKGRLASIQARPSLGEINMDMSAALQRFSAMAEHYEVMSTAEDTFKAFIKVLERREYQPADPAVTLGKWTKGKFTPKGRKQGPESNVVRRAKKWMSMVFYDNDQITKGFLEKVTDNLMEYSSLSYVAFNPFGNFNNYALGRINNSIEAIGQRFYSAKAYARAEYEFNKRALPDLIYRMSAVAKKVGNKSDYDPELPSSKYEALVDLFRMMDERAEMRETMTGPPPITKSWARRFADFGYSLQDAAEYNVQTKVGMAILIDTMIMNKTTGDVISLYDAYEFDSETKEVKLKEGYDTIVKLDKKNIDENGNSKFLKEENYNDQYRYQVRNKIREVNKQIHGNYAKDDRMVIQSYAVGRLAAQFHKWVAPAIKARFRREYFDENLGWMEGRYRSFWKFLAYSTKQLATFQLEFSKHGENFMEQYGYTGDGSQRDERARDKLLGAYRTMGEISIIMLTIALNQILAGMFADDDDDTEFEKKMENFLRYQADRTYKELILFTPLGSEQIYQMFKSPIAATRTLGEFGEALSLSVRTPIFYLFESKEDFYADSDFVYQRGTRKGELKLNKNWADVLPLIYSIKKYNDFLNLTNFYIK